MHEKYRILELPFNFYVDFKVELVGFLCGSQTSENMGVPKSGDLERKYFFFMYYILEISLGFHIS